MPARTGFVYEAGDDNPDDPIFLQTLIIPAEGTPSFQASYTDKPGEDYYIHQHIGFPTNGVNVYRDIYRFARAAGVPI